MRQGRRGEIHEWLMEGEERTTFLPYFQLELYVFTRIYCYVSQWLNVVVSGSKVYVVASRKGSSVAVIRLVHKTPGWGDQKQNIVVPEVVVWAFHFQFLCVLCTSNFTTNKKEKCKHFCMTILPFCMTWCPLPLLPREPTHSGYPNLKLYRWLSINNTSIHHSFSMKKVLRCFLYYIFSFSLLFVSWYFCIRILTFKFVQLRFCITQQANELGSKTFFKKQIHSHTHTHKLENL